MPLRMSSEWNETVTPFSIKNTRTVLFPLILTCVSRLEPSMVTSLSSMRVESSTMVCPARDGSKVILPPLATSATAWRREPSPLSSELVTMISPGNGGVSVEAEVSEGVGVKVFVNVGV